MGVGLKSINSLHCKEFFYCCYDLVLLTNYVINISNIYYHFFVCTLVLSVPSVLSKDIIRLTVDLKLI